MRRVVQSADRKVLTSAAVTATAIAVVATVGLSMDTSPPEAPDIAPLAESGPGTTTSAPSDSRKASRLLLPRGEYLT